MCLKPKDKNANFFHGALILINDHLSKIEDIIEAIKCLTKDTEMRNYRILIILLTGDVSIVGCVWEQLLTLESRSLHKYLNNDSLAHTWTLQNSLNQTIKPYMKPKNKHPPFWRNTIINHSSLFCIVRMPRPRHFLIFFITFRIVKSIKTRNLLTFTK